MSKEIWINSYGLLDFKNVNMYTLKEKCILIEHDLCVVDVPCLKTFCNSKHLALKKSSYCKGFIALKIKH